MKLKVVGKSRTVIGTNDTPNKSGNEKETRLFGRIGNVVKDWGEDIFTTLKYRADSEKIVQLQCNSKDEREKLLKNPQYLDLNNFRLQIGKMQEDGGTLYNEISLGIGIEYMINHTKEGHQSVIQIWSDVGDKLQPGSEKGILTALEEKKKLENFIEKKFGDKGKVIKVEIGSEKYPDVFNALSSGKRGIIPDKEPDLDSINEFSSPLQIIQFLAYNASKDGKLMELFYNTKPSKYIGKDAKNHLKPGDSDADFYGVIEVGLRLYEVLNGVSIQGGLGRQRVYDKIISLIINGKDTIKGKEIFDSDYKLFIKDYPALQRLHKFCKERYPNTKFNQLYIELSGGDNGGIKEIEAKINKKDKLKSKLKSWGYGALIALTLSGIGSYTKNNIAERKMREKQELYEQERLEMRRQYSDSLSKVNGVLPLQNYEMSEQYREEQSNILIAEYDISKFNHVTNQFDDIILTSNDISEMYRDAFYHELRENIDEHNILKDCDLSKLTDEQWMKLYGNLTAEDFMFKYGGTIIDKYHLYQKPYEHFKPYQDAIKNTLQYGDKIDISKYKTKEISTETELSYFIKHYDSFEYQQDNNKNSHGFYRLKIVRVFLEKNKTIDVVLAYKDTWHWMKKSNGGKYTLEDGFKCMKDLSENYGYVLK